MENETLTCIKSLPPLLKIGPYDWKVRLREESGGDLCGQADFGTHELNLWPQNLTSPSHVAGIVIHECLHGIWDTYGLEKAPRKKDEREEAIVVGFEAGLISLFRDNPKFLNWLKKWLRG